MSETWSITTWQLGAAISGVPHSNQTKMHSKRYSNNGKYHYMSCLSILPNQNPCSLACAAYRRLEARNYAINNESLKIAFQNKLTHNPVRNVTSQWRRWYRKVIDVTAIGSTWFCPLKRWYPTRSKTCRFWGQSHDKSICDIDGFSILT